VLISALPAAAAEPASASASRPAAGVVNPKQVYSYDIMVRDLKQLEETYPGLIRLHAIGESEYGRDIWAADLGLGDAYVMLNGSHHAREWITTILIMSMLDHYAQAYVRNETWNGAPVRDLLHRVTFRFVPMVNPDGVTLQQFGLSAFPEEAHADLIAMNGGSSNFKRWKANAKGIDLNRQYPADWENINQPGSGPYYMNYRGKEPLAAKEAQAMAEATKETNPEIAVAYHSSGEIVYWHFHTKPEHVVRDRAIATRYAGMTGYRLVQPAANPSGGGYTDWFIQSFGRPGLTAELGRPAGETNVPLSEWERIWPRHRDTGWMLAGEAYNLWLARQTAAYASGEIRLTAEQPAYRWPDHRSAKLGTLYPGRYKLLRTKGGWAEIATEAGPRWAWAGRSPSGTFEPLGGIPVRLAPDMAQYLSPLDAAPAPQPLDAPSATALERWNDWIMVVTPQGTRWVKEADLFGE
jgi:g-D-glutamyl-meso-diaminopimelate peptidase